MKKIKNIIFNNIVLKIFALVLAVILWFYIVEELNRLALEEEIGIKTSIPHAITAKMLPIIAYIKGNVVAGYQVNNSKIVITPPACNVIGIKRLLDKIDFIKTVPIDVSGHTKTITVRVALESPARGIKIIEKFATVAVPIEKIK